MPHGTQHIETHACDLACDASLRIHHNNAEALCVVTGWRCPTVRSLCDEYLPHQLRHRSNVPARRNLSYSAIIPSGHTVVRTVLTCTCFELVGALFVSFCFSFSICLIRAKNYVGAQVILQDLQEELVCINSRGSFPRGNLHQFIDWVIYTCISLHMSFLASQRKENSISLTDANFCENSLTFTCFFQTH